MVLKRSREALIGRSRSALFRARGRMRRKAFQADRIASLPDLRSPTNRRYSRALSSASLTRSRYDGWMVTTKRVPSDCVKMSPRTDEIDTLLPNRLRAAVAPRATTTFGLIIALSISIHQRH